MKEYRALLNPKKYKLMLLEDFNEELKDFDSEAAKALKDKFEHMVLYRDLDSAIRMLKSFNKGVKRIKGMYSKRSREKEYTWVKSAHGEYISMGENEPRAHFRWDYGNKYVLTNDEIEAINFFLKYAGFGN